MKNIIVLSILYENEVVLKEFELLKDHYNKIIDYFCFPIKYYGVRATEEGETRIDEDNQIIWLHTDDIKTYDAKLICKDLDCFKFIDKNINYDVLVKTNTSFLINLPMMNNIIQNTKDGTIYTTELYRNAHPELPYYIRGNFMTFDKSVIKFFISNMNVDMDANMDYLAFCSTPYMADDLILSRYCIMVNAPILPLGQYVTNRDKYLIVNVPESMDDIFGAIGITTKYYEFNNLEKYKDCTDDIDKRCLDIVLLKLFMEHTEKSLIHPRKKELITTY